MRRILVVDDDPHMSLAIQAWLKRYGFKVEIADGGTAGLAAIANSTFDLMIVDIFMPHMRGFESIRMFHDRAPSVPLIAISGYAFSNLEASSPELLQLALKAWRDALSAQALQANNLVECDRRVPVGGRASSQVFRRAGLHGRGGVGTRGRGGIPWHAGGRDVCALSLPRLRGTTGWRVPQCRWEQTGGDALAPGFRSFGANKGTKTGSGDTYAEYSSCRR